VSARVVGKFPFAVEGPAAVAGDGTRVVAAVMNAVVRDRVVFRHRGAGGEELVEAAPPCSPIPIQRKCWSCKPLIVTCDAPSIVISSLMPVLELVDAPSRTPLPLLAGGD